MTIKEVEKLLLACEVDFEELEQNIFNEEERKKRQ